MEKKRYISRREFFRLTTLAGAGVVMAACAPAAPTSVAPAATEALEATDTPVPAKATDVPAAPTATPTEPPTPVPPPAYKEAPMLADMVKAGKIPAIDKRLPGNPMVFTTIEQTGKHGGVIRRAYKGVSDRWGPTKMIDKGFVWFDKSLNMRPRLAEAWTTNKDGSEWTFNLRKGTKWSDGTEFTTKDVKWWFDNIVMNKTLTPSIGTTWSTANPTTPMTLDIKDDYTVTFKFAKPKPLFVLLIGRAMPAAPGFYLEQWHGELTKDKAGLDAKVKAAGFDSWDKYFANDRNYWYANPELPTLQGWNAKEPLGKDLFVMVRNPYFWGVDSEGNQLPYFDQVNHRLFTDPNVYNLWITNGEIDFQARHVDTAQYTLYKTNEEKGKFKVYKGISAGHMGFNLNQGCKNDKLREFFQTRNVRIALSLSIDRDQINELVYNGLATPRQYSPISISPQYYEKLSTAYIKQDIDQANKLLDEAGYDKKDADGFRMYKDGSGTISFTMEGIDNIGTPAEDAYNQVVKMFAKVGVKAAYKYDERSLYEQRYNANEIEVSTWGGDRTVLPLAPEAPIFRGVMMDRPWAGAYGLWKNNPKDPNGVEPPKDFYIWKIWDLWDQISVEPDPAKQNDLFKQVLDIWATELPVIGVLGEIPAFAIVKNGIKNFVDGFPMDDTTGDEEVYNAETYTWDDPTAHQG